MKLEQKKSFTTHEYHFSFCPQRDNFVITAFSEYKDNECWLEIWLKTTVDMGLSHFVVGFKIDSESKIDEEVMRLFENGYFEDFYDSAYEDEIVLEERHCEMMNEEE